MGLQDVKALVDGYHGLPSGAPLDGNAARLSIGDLRLLLHCANMVIAEARDPQMWLTMLNYEASDGVSRAD